MTPPPPPLGICGSIAAAAGRILGLVLLTTALAGAFAVGLQAESAKPQNFAFANLLAVAAVAQTGIPNSDFPATHLVSDSTIPGTFCSNAGGSQQDAIDNNSEFGLWCQLDIHYDGVDYAGCYYHAGSSNFDQSQILIPLIALGLPDCRNVIPFCPDSRKVPDSKGNTNNPFTGCQACADFNREDGNPECGNCLANFAEDDSGLCRATQDCAEDNRVQTDAFTCGSCLSGFTDDAGSCKENKTCANEKRVQTNAFTCGACVSGFTEGAGSCQENKTCANENRIQTNAYTCGACVFGYTDSAGSCQADKNCAAENRVQIDGRTCGGCIAAFTEGEGKCNRNRYCPPLNRVQVNAYTCGDCLANHGEINEQCVHETNALPENEATCADIFGGDWVDLSAAHGAGKGVCSGIDINDTFCLTGTVSALPCLGLFNHVRSCNLLGRPALDPFHCGKACAGGKAAGARCLESE